MTEAEIKKKYVERVVNGELSSLKASSEILATHGITFPSRTIRNQAKKLRNESNHPNVAAISDGNIGELSGYWDKTKDGVSLYYKIEKTTEEQDPVNYGEVFAGLIERLGKDLPKVDAPKLEASKFAIRLVTSDEHVGMDCLAGRSLFGYEYSGEIYKSQMAKVKRALFKEFSTHGAAEVLFLDGLGDFQDGWGRKTTRGLHELPQNMTEAEVFETCVWSKLDLIRFAIDQGLAQKIIVRNVLNDNHAGRFAEVVNTGLKILCGEMFGDVVEVDTLKRFVEIRQYGKHAHLLCHGKDSQHRRAGMPLRLDDKTRSFINDIIEHNNIRSPFIHFDKGDLHQSGYDVSKRFDYRNFASFAPPSAYVQDSYGNSASSFAVQVVPKLNNEIAHTDYRLNYEKKAV